MALLNKSDLVYEDDYTWTASDGDNPKYTGAPDNVLLNRNEGYEVLPFLNRYAQRRNGKKIDALKAEWLIREHLPSSIRHRDKIAAWLDANWTEHDKDWNRKVDRGDIVV